MKKIKLSMFFLAFLTVLSGCTNMREREDLNLSEFEEIESEEIMSREGYELQILETSVLNADVVFDLVWANPEKTICAGFQNKEGYFYFAEYDFETKEELWRGPNLNCSFFMDTVLLNETEYILSASWIGDSNRIKVNLVELKTGDELWAIESRKLPFYSVIGDKLYLTVTQGNNEKMTDAVYVVDSKGKCEIIDCFEYTIDESGLYTGDSITAMGGVEDVVYLQISMTQKEQLEKGKVKVLQFDLDGTLRKTFTMDIPAQFVSGDSQIALVSQHGYEHPLFSSGVLYDLKKQNQDILQDVSSGNDISYMEKRQGQYWFATHQQVYMMDEKIKKIKLIDSQENMGSYSLREYGFSYLCGQVGEQKIVVVQAR